jgi:hypothetical protein
MSTSRQVSVDLIKEDEMCGACSTRGRYEKHTTLAKKPEGKIPLVRIRRSCGVRTKMHIKETGREGMD